MSRGPDAETLLRRALESHAEAAGCPVALVESDWTRWASATFSGARHLLALAGPPSPALDAWIACPRRNCACAAISLPTWQWSMSAARRTG